MKMGVQKEKIYKIVQDDLRHILNNIFKKLSVNEKEQLKEELQMMVEKQEENFKDRIIARIQNNKPLEFLAVELRKIGRDNLLWDELESMSQ